jgi:hypothetical protein
VNERKYPHFHSIANLFLVLLPDLHSDASHVTSHPANELMTDSNNSRFVNVDTASILVEWIMKGVVEDEEEYGLDAGGIFSMAGMTESTT